jgi:uncharacterized membrane protein YoaK (UPF0700 family)
MQAYVTGSETQATLNNVVRRIEYLKKGVNDFSEFSAFSRGAWIGGFVLRSIGAYTWMEMVIAQCSTLKYL